MFQHPCIKLVSQLQCSMLGWQCLAAFESARHAPATMQGDACLPGSSSSTLKHADTPGQAAGL